MFLLLPLTEKKAFSYQNQTLNKLDENLVSVKSKKHSILSPVPHKLNKVGSWITVSASFDAISTGCNCIYPILEGDTILFLLSIQLSQRVCVPQKTLYISAAIPPPIRRHTYTWELFFISWSNQNNDLGSKYFLEINHWVGLIAFDHVSSHQFLP